MDDRLGRTVAGLRRDVVTDWKAEALYQANRADRWQRAFEKLGWACTCDRCLETSERHALLAGIASVLQQRLSFLEMREELRAFLEET